MALKWKDVEDIAILLHEAQPSVDPLKVRFTDLRDRVLELKEFGDDPAHVNEKILEAIQMAWYEEYKGE